MREMMDFQSWKERRAEVMREVEISRQAKRVRETRKLGAGGRSAALVWELKRHAGRLLKLLRTSRNVG